MANADTVLVVDKDGLRGNVYAHELHREDTPRVFLRLENGRTVMVEKRLLQQQGDGSYYLPLSVTNIQESSAQSANEIVLPVIAEEIDVQKREIENRRIRITKTVDEREVLVDQPLTHEHVAVNRVVVNQMVDEPPPIRHEGDTMIVPVLEEVVVIDVRLVVREELHITRRREEIHEPQRVVLRREEVHVETLDGQGDAFDENPT